MKTVILPDAEAVARRAASVIARTGREAVELRVRKPAIRRSWT